MICKQKLFKQLYCIQTIQLYPNKTFHYKMGSKQWELQKTSYKKQCTWWWFWDKATTIMP